VETAAASRRTEVELLADALRKFARRDARANIAKLLRKARPGDVATILPDLTPAEQIDVFRILVTEFPDSAGEVLTELEPPPRSRLLSALSPGEIAALLETLSVDDAVYVVESLPEEVRGPVLELVDLRDLAAVQSHLTYEDDSAGRIMDSEFLALPESTTVREAIATIQEGREVDMIFYLYVVDDHGHLVGVTSLRQLLLSPPERTLGEIMTRSVIQVDTGTDQEEVAQLAARYDLLAIPVVDEARRLVGIVTVDDIIDIVKEEATEDFYKMVGTSDNELLYQERSFRVAGIRLPWLLVNLAGLVVTGLLLRRFQVSLKEALFLLTFVPVIMGMGGNIGSQTATITVRGLATGRIGRDRGRLRRFLWQQTKVGEVLGVACALLVAVGAFVLEQNLYYALVVGVSLFLAIVVASVNGALVPLVFERLGVDPAIASGPLVTTSNDITGILIYFGLASLLIELLVR
jgi:magnesium transporter